jgi:molecular chaperone GrpE (heat shock protein)
MHGPNLATTDRMSGSIPEIKDNEFSSQMEQLAAQASSGTTSRALTKEKRAGAEPAPNPAGGQNVPGELLAGLEKKIGPLIAALEALGRASVRQSNLIEGLETATRRYEPLAEEVSHIRNAQDERNAIDQRMFNALHEELKTYKDEFLLDVLQKPVVSGLVTLHDDLSEVCRQVQEILGKECEAGAQDGGKPAKKALNYIATNLEHAVHTLIEVMSRIGVELIELRTHKLDRKHQKAISVEPAASIEEDGEVVKTLRRGFVWRNRVFRAEEVVIKKFREGCLVAMPQLAETDREHEEQAGTRNENR